MSDEYIRSLPGSLFSHLSDRLLAVGSVLGTAIQQAFGTFFSSYKHFNITNADTLPAAIFVNMLTYAVEKVENANRKLTSNPHHNWIFRDAPDGLLVFSEVKFETEMGFESKVDAAVRRGDTTGGAMETSGMAGDMSALTSMMNTTGLDGAELDASFTPRLLCVSDGGLPMSLHLGKKPYEEYGCFDQAASTILMLIMITSISVGCLLVLLGTKLNAGPLISFVPVTVQCAFLAGCGGSIFKKGVFFMVDIQSLTKSFGAGAGQILVNLAPVIGMSVFILWAEEHLHHTRFGRVALPGLLVFLTGVFYVMLFFYFTAQAGTTAEGEVYNWEDAMLDAQDPAANGGRSFLPPLSDGRGWLMSPDEIDNSGRYHPFFFGDGGPDPDGAGSVIGTLCTSTRNPHYNRFPERTLTACLYVSDWPQFTHFRLYHYIINPIKNAVILNADGDAPEFMTQDACEACASDDDTYLEGCIWADADGAVAGSVFPQFDAAAVDSTTGGVCHHRQFKWCVMWSAIFNSKQVVNLVVITIVTLLGTTCCLLLATCCFLLPAQGRRGSNLLLTCNVQQSS